MAQGVTEAQRGVLLSGMSDASCGMTLARSEAWVARKRRLLAGLVEPVQALSCGGSTPWSPDVDPFKAAEACDARRDRPETAKETGARAFKPSARATTWSRDNRIEIVKPVTPRVVSWARRFAAADWPIDAVADLFDVDGADLSAALAGAGRS